MSIDLGLGSNKSKQSQSSNPTFNLPEARRTLNLTESRVNELGQPNPFFQGVVGQDPGNNPWLSDFIGAQQGQTMRGIGEGLAQIRSAGSRGGRGRSELNQGRFITDALSNFNQQALGLRANQFNQDRQMQMTAANQLVNQQLSELQATMAFLDMLRGQEGQGSQRGTTMGANVGFSIPGWGQQST